MLSPEAARAGEKLGGEGGQWPCWDITVSPADPNFLLLPIDVGGLHAARDGGKTWNIAMNGWNARGANNFAIDPRNIYASAATLVRSRDGGATWENLTTGGGPHEISWVRVHPKTGGTWLNGQCYGMWRIPRPTKLGAASSGGARCGLIPWHRDAARFPHTTFPTHGAGALQ